MKTKTKFLSATLAIVLFLILCLGNVGILYAEDVTLTHTGVISGAGASNYLDGASNVAVAGNYAYVTSFNDDALTIIDISDPANPTHAGVISGAGAPNYLDGASNVAVAGNYAYIASSYDDALTVIDISDPANPTHAGVISGAGAPNYLGGAYNVAVAGNYAYVASFNDDALTIFNIELPILAAGEDEELAPIRTHPMTASQIFVNDDNNFEFIFFWEYKDNNWVQIYDMDWNLVWEIDFKYGRPRFEADLPDGTYTVRTFHEGGKIIQEFVIGKPAASSE